MAKRVSRSQSLPMLSESAGGNVVPPPCLVCRRRFRPGGRQVFTNCTCLQYGRSYTVLFCALGGVATVAATAIVVKRDSGARF